MTFQLYSASGAFDKHSRVDSENERVRERETHTKSIRQTSSFRLSMIETSEGKNSSSSFCVFSTNFFTQNFSRDDGIIIATMIKSMME